MCNRTLSLYVFCFTCPRCIAGRDGSHDSKHNESCELALKDCRTTYER